MMGAINLCTINLPPIDRREVLRYAGVRCGDGAEYSGALDQLEQILSPRLSPKACYIELPLKAEGNLLEIGNISIESASLAAHLSGCKAVVLIAVTVGVALDREISRLGASSPLKQLLADAIGTERVEAACDALCQRISAELSGEGRRLTSRFSAGYGDLPLSLQRQIFAVLDCPRQIGLTLNESLLMSPTKSVTAIVGIH